MAVAAVIFADNYPSFPTNYTFIAHCEKNIEDSLQNKIQINCKTLKNFIYKNAFFCFSFLSRIYYKVSLKLFGQQKKYSGKLGHGKIGTQS